jgi:serine/threonine-protein kinase
MNTGKTHQRCPVCQAQNDVSVYVSGQQVRCVKCGLAFDVQRPDIPQPAKTAAKSQSIRPPPREGPVPDAQAQQPPPAIPGYEKFEVIGRGGMGTVYKARQVSLSREVAIKILSGELAVDQGFIDRFNREASALAKLSHPNIVPIIDKGSVQGVYYFVMDFVHGNTLRDLLRGGRLPQDETIAVSLQVCRALVHAHKAGVVHRDMKPENVLLDPERNVRIADFGLADIVGYTTWGTLTGSGMAMGTAHYMAPEQRKDAKRVDLRADLYSMGIMIYEMLTGEIPQGHFRRPSEHTPGTNPAWDNIVIRCLQPSPDDRYRTAEDLARDIRAVTQKPASQPARPQPGPEAAQPEPAGDQAPEQPPPQEELPPTTPEPMTFKAAPSFTQEAKRLAREMKPASARHARDIKPISVRRRQKKVRLILFAAGTVLIVAAAIILAKSCL